VLSTQIVATVKVADPSLAREALSTDGIPVVPRARGFVAAYGHEPVDGIGMSVIVFDSKEHADAALAYPLPKLPGSTPIEARARGLRQHPGLTAADGDRGVSASRF
jgi:hypothetical protein